MAAGAKEHADMEDIMKVLQVCDKEGTALPKFFALDLGNIPPISPDQVDMTVPLSQFSIMQGELGDLKSAVQSLQNTSVKEQTAPKQQPLHHGLRWPLQLLHHQHSGQSQQPPLAAQPASAQPSGHQGHGADVAQQAVQPQHQKPDHQVQQEDGFTTAYRTTKHGRRRK